MSFIIYDNYCHDQTIRLLIMYHYLDPFTGFPIFGYSSTCHRIHMTHEIIIYEILLPCWQSLHYFINVNYTNSLKKKNDLQLTCFSRSEFWNHTKISALPETVAWLHWQVLDCVSHFPWSEALSLQKTPRCSPLY